MKHYAILLTALLLSAAAAAQDKRPVISGKWKTEDKAIVEFYDCGKLLCVKQLEAEKPDDKKHNGKQIGKDIRFASADKLEGLVINPKNGKDYKAAWKVSADGKKLLLNVKWGFMSFSEEWRKME